MARTYYGGDTGTSAFVVGDDGRTMMLPVSTDPASASLVYMPDKTTQVTDLLSRSGVPATSVLPSANGDLDFFGPDNNYAGDLMLKDAFGTFKTVHPTALGDRVAAVESTVASLPTSGYEPPAGGIPETDLAAAVQTKLDSTAGLRTDLDALQAQVDGLPAPGVGPAGPVGPSEVVLAWSGALPAAGTTVSVPRPNTFGAARVITAVSFVLGTVSTSGAVTIDVLNGTLAITSTANRPTLAANASSHVSQTVTTIDSTAAQWADGGLLWLKFIASGTGAANMSVFIRHQAA